MAQKPETKFRNNVVYPFLRTLKNTVVFSIQQVAISGDPDAILCSHGLFVALELKDTNGVLSPLQKWKLEEVKKRGKGISIIASPDNWRQVTYLLGKLDQGAIDD